MERLLDIPLGGPGSGRDRYAVAMGLYAQGQMSAAALECYRVAAAHDRIDPARLLAERGLTAPLVTPSAAMSALVDAVADYIATLPGPGIATVCQGIAAFRHGPVSVVQSPAHPVCAAHLPAALAALGQTHPGLAVAISAAAPHLHWQTYGSYEPAQIGPAFASGHAYASIIGQDAAIPANDFDLGLFLIAPHVLYRDHRHAAPELYAPLTGPHGWRFAPDTPLDIKPAHEPVWNPAHQPHLTKVGPTPFLCIFAWTGDVDQPATVLPASDWTALEALRLGPAVNLATTTSG